MLTVLPPHTTEKEFFRQVMGRFATGVTLVTTQFQGRLWGLTVNSFCSVSLHPPLILICINLKSHSIALIRQSGIFAVNILSEQQEQIACDFATSSQERADYFSRIPYHIAATGAPILDASHAFVDTHVVAEYPGGDHSVFLGHVVAMGTADHGDSVSKVDRQSEHTHDDQADDPSPLVYYCGKYHDLHKYNSIDFKAK